MKDEIKSPIEPNIIHQIILKQIEKNNKITINELMAIANVSRETIKKK